MTYRREEVNEVMSINRDQPQFEIVENYEPPRTSCDEYGHDFEDYEDENDVVRRACRDCGEPAEVDND